MHTEILPYDQFSPHQEILSARMAALYRLPQMQRGVLIATADALIQRLPPRAWLESRTLMLNVRTNQWDDELLQVLGNERPMLAAHQVLLVDLNWALSDGAFVGHTEASADDAATGVSSISSTRL